MTNFISSLMRKLHSVDLTEKGIDELTKAYNDSSFFILPDVGSEIAELERSGLSNDEKLIKKSELLRNYSEKSERLHTVQQLLKAYTLFEKDVDYVIMDNKIKIVDEQTGRIMEGRRWSDEILEPLIDKATKREHDSIIVALQQKYPFYPMKDINLDYYDHEAYLSKYTLASLKNNYSDKIIAQVIPFVGNLILLLFMFFFYRRHLKKNRSEMTEQSKILKNEQNLKDLEGNIFKSSPSVSYNNGVTYTSKHFEYEFEHTGNSVKENERRNNSSTNNQIRGLKKGC